MAKVKDAKANANVPNKPSHIRVSYLYQAAALLAQHQHSKPQPASKTIETNDAPANDTPAQLLQPASRHLISDLRSVSLKAQIRVSPAMKHSICKNCNTMLVEASTCTIEIENKSKGGKKPWADVLIRKCNTCGLAKRFPLAPVRQKRRPHRSPKTQAALRTSEGV